MGLFSFLSRRAGDKNKTRASLKALPYDSSVSVETPTLGGYSVAGSNSFAEPPSLSRERSTFSQSVLTLDTDSEDELPDVTPRPPRFHDESVERPNTAPSDRPSSAAPSNDGSKGGGRRRPPPLSFRAPRAEMAAPVPRPGSRGSISSITSVFRRTKGHSRVNSRQDANRAFKDLLEAQSEIKSADSRARVQAAGARNYGEDVAERNMGQNGCDLGSEHVKAFYAQPRRADSGDFRSLPGGKKLDPYKAGVRRRSALPNQYALPAYPAPESTSTVNPRRSRKVDLARRRSVSTYLPPGLGKIKFLPFDRTSAYLRDSAPRTPTPEAEKLDVTAVAVELPTPVMPQLPKTTPAPVSRSARFRDSVELAKKRAETSVPEDSVADDAPASNFAAWSANRSRRSSAMLMPTSPQRRNHSLYTLRSSTSSVVSEETVHTTPLSPPKVTPGDQVQGAAGNPAHSATRSFGNNDASSIAGSSLASRPTTAKSHEGAEVPSPKFLPLLPVKGPGHTPDVVVSGDQALGFPPSIRTRSMRGWSASSGTPTACESSTAASITTSTFNRPPSLHTADTSVDFSIGTTSPKFKPARSSTRTCSTARDSDSDADSTSLYETAANTPFRPESTEVGRAFNIEDYLSPEPDSNTTHANEDTTITATTTTAPINPTEPASDTFNIDDYLSSDPESLTAAAATTTTTSSPTSPTKTQTHTPTHRRRPTAEGEEYLLLKGFGISGTQLPGIADPFPPPSPLLPPPPPPRERGTVGRTMQRHILLALLLGLFFTIEWGWGWWGGEAEDERRFILDTAADDETASDLDDDEEEEEEEEEEDEAGDEKGNGRRNINNNNNGAMKLRLGDMDDAGYEADYVEDECECGARLRRRQNRKKRTRRLSALCRLEGREEEGGQDGVQLGEEERKQQQLEETQKVEEEKKVEDKVAAAVRLRKEGYPDNGERRNLSGFMGAGRSGGKD
ncbi:hypothetical protein CHGG_04735 [Chaetomium globosum CBS 148.51]|uniref:Uncharacterized protein n=1 Tax=Chaetomium globosum (strain ATCC 6205 / CBS 148.51 / DSM 1962 / NBRC 6347 / NRRL 1970) TaxID=306901 RepID=Q2H0G1_CHAGB|nr:uncharacterized protein CHGG_04735 [Chaetomium globosum CBS 148.51]EAQ88116.1 hypothetical protein CHGG_04735 [Chaetomium globosum CBS 148.51]